MTIALNYSSGVRRRNPLPTSSLANQNNKKRLCLETEKQARVQRRQQVASCVMAVPAVTQRKRPEAHFHSALPKAGDKLRPLPKKWKQKHEERRSKDVLSLISPTSRCPHIIPREPKRPDIEILFDHSFNISPNINYVINYVIIPSEKQTNAHAWSKENCSLLIFTLKESSLIPLKNHTNYTSSRYLFYSKYQVVRAFL